MASCRKTYDADFFKKDDKNPPQNHDKVTKSDDNKVTKGASQTSNDNEDDVKNFNNEDERMARLYRQVVDDMMEDCKLQERAVDGAILNIKRNIHLGYKRGFITFSGINFSKPKNRCGYLRCYAMCHTGLVKKAIWQFLLKDDPTNLGILRTDNLKVVNLGGGPGNELIGFCSVLQEMVNNIKELDLKIVDISQGWVAVFPSILKKAERDNSGSISELMKSMKITTSFIRANLNRDAVFEDKTITSVLSEANVVLMVKLMSLMSKNEKGKLIQNVVKTMQDGALLIFIDHPYDEEFFKQIPDLKSVYYDYIKYELSFKPSRYLCPSISSAQAYIGVFVKELTDTTDEESADF